MPGFIGRLYYSASSTMCCAHAISESTHVLGAQADQMQLRDVLIAAGFFRGSAARPRRRSIWCSKQGPNRGVGQEKPPFRRVLVGGNQAASFRAVKRTLPAERLNRSWKRSMLRECTTAVSRRNQTSLSPS
jgi:hypothetical protein